MPFDRTCPGCDKEFVTPFRPQRFCSKECAGAHRGSIKPCQGCGHDFRCTRKDSFFCSVSCRRKNTKPKRRTCAANDCKNRFGYARNPQKRYCSDNCSARARYEKKPLNACRYCKTIVARRSSHGVAPSVCDGCAELHHRVISRQWRDKNPVKWKQIKARFAAKMDSFKYHERLGIQANKDLIDRYALFKEASKNVKWKKKFWLDMFDYVHHAYLNIRVQKHKAVYCFEEWSRVKYTLKKTKKSNQERQWERWKSKVFNLRIAERQEDEHGRVFVSLDLELAKFVSNMILEDIL